MLALITGKLLPYIIAGFGALAAVAGIYLKGQSAGKNKERAKWQEREAKTRKQQDALIAKARSARNGVRSTYDDLMSDDGFKRD